MSTVTKILGQSRLCMKERGKQQLHRELHKDQAGKRNGIRDTATGVGMDLLIKTGKAIRGMKSEEKGS